MNCRLKINDITISSNRNSILLIEDNSKVSSEFNDRCNNCYYNGHSCPWHSETFFVCELIKDNETGEDAIDIGKIPYFKDITDEL